MVVGRLMRPWCTQTLHARDPYEGSLRHQAQWNEADKQAPAEIYRGGQGPVPGNHGWKHARGAPRLPSSTDSCSSIFLLRFSLFVCFYPRFRWDSILHDFGDFLFFFLKLVYRENLPSFFFEKFVEKGKNFEFQGEIKSICDVR